jgi:hypothetical protein
MLTSRPTLMASAAASRGLLAGHGWHTIEALGFLITSLGGIAAAEYVQARARRARVIDERVHSTANASTRTTQLVAASAGISSSVGLLPERAVAAAAAAPAVPIVTHARTRATLLPLVAMAGAAAAAVHFVVMPEHFEEATMYGAFFAAAATSQLLYSVLLLARPSRTLLAAGAFGNVSIALLWLVTRTIGIPLGPAAGSTESFGGLDVLATIFELTAAIGAIVVISSQLPLLRTIRPSTWSPTIWALGSGAAVAIAATAVISPPS